MRTYDMNGNLVAEGYMVENENFIARGEYQETELDIYKKNVDFLITSVGKRYEVIFNHPVNIKASRSIDKRSECVYFVTEKALDALKAKYTYCCDF